MDAETLIERVRTRLPDAFLESIDGLSGEELLAIFAAIFARTSERRVTAARARLIRDATGPVRASGSVTVHFAEATGINGYDVAAMLGDEPLNQVLFQTPWGVRYVLTTALSRTALDAPGDVVVTVEAQYAGWDGNVRGDCVTEWAIPDTSNIDSLTFSVGSIVNAREEFLAGVRSGSITFTAGNMTGGRAGTLDLKAQGRGMPRSDGELDAALRKRLRAPPDAVTPAGILRAVNKALGADVATMSEYWDYGFAMGVSAMGEAALAARRGVIVFVPAGSDLVALQALVNRIKAAGYTVTVMEASS